jgi:hypothetical protein
MFETAHAKIAICVPTTGARCALSVTKTYRTVAQASNLEDLRCKLERRGAERIRPHAGSLPS